jgi:RNA polymerase sigma-70 factor (ECF subfamily)
MSGELFERYKRDRNPQDYARLVEEHRALVYSVVQRYLRDPNDADDAAQETFLRLARRIDEVSGSLTGWLMSTAQSCCVDLIRKAIRERRRREGLATASVGPAEKRFLHEMIHARLHEALLTLDCGARELVIARFFRKESVRALAGQKRTSIATISRRVSAAMRDLAAVLREMGIDAADDKMLAEHFGEPVNAAVDAAGEGLRFAPDWGALLSNEMNPTVPAAYAPGWKRRIRVGTFVSYQSARVRFPRGMSNKIEHQVWSTPLIVDPRVELVSIVQSNTSHLAAVERTLRDYELVGGLIDSTDADAMSTLDVIMLGVNFAMEDSEAAAILGAVRGGVGLLKEFWIGAAHLTHLPDSAEMRELSLAQAPWGAYHTKPTCGQRTTATVLEEHSLLPGLKAGDEFSVSPACGPVYRAAAGAKLLMEKGPVLSEEEHGVAGLGPMKLPAFIVGNVGRGRVIVSNLFSQFELSAAVSVSSQEYLLNVLRWLGEGRREG